MSNLGSWLQDNWYDLGTLLTLVALLIAGVWFARNFLKTLTAFQDQLGALLKLSPTTPSEGVVKSPSVKQALAESISSWLQTPIANATELGAEGPNRLTLAGVRMFSWLREPAHAISAAPLRRMMRWFQAPIGS